jgi:hypothetical protein
LIFEQLVRAGNRKQEKSNKGILSFFQKSNRSPILSLLTIKKGFYIKQDHPKKSKNKANGRIFVFSALQIYKNGMLSLKPDLPVASRKNESS